MRFTLKSLKAELKQLSKDITETKALHKGAQRACSKSGIDLVPWNERKTKVTPEMTQQSSDRWHQFCQLGKLQYDFRHKHIVYCTLRGRTRDQIEKPKEHNKPNEKYLGELTEHYMFLAEEEVKREQVICNSEARPL